jgi:hypothetical protein
MVFFGLRQLVGLLVIVHPRTPAAILATLLQAGVPHRPAHIRSPVRKPGLLGAELHPKPPTSQHIRVKSRDVVYDVVV